MNTKITLAAVGLAALTVGGLGVGTAFAAGSTPATAETDNTQQGPDVQQGDQNAPDVAGAGAESDSAPASATSVAPASNLTHLTVAAPTTASREKSTPETAGSEAAGVSDGPGGHADQGNADHQFNGNE